MTPQERAARIAELESALAASRAMREAVANERLANVALRTQAVNQELEAAYRLNDKLKGKVTERAMVLPLRRADGKLLSKNERRCHGCNRRFSCRCEEIAAAGS